MTDDERAAWVGLRMGQTLDHIQGITDEAIDEDLRANYLVALEVALTLWIDGEYGKDPDFMQEARATWKRNLQKKV